MQKSDNKKEQLRKYHYWYVDTFLQSINYDDFYKRVQNINWLKESLQNMFIKDPDIQSPVYYGSIWRHEILDNLKFYITPKKTENIVTVFKMDRTHSLGLDRSVEFHTTFAFLYSVEENGKIEHQYVCLGPTFQSADGEYRRRFISYKQFQYIMSQYKELVNTISDQIIQWISKKIMSINVESFFPRFMHDRTNFSKIQKGFMEQIDKERIIIDIYTSVWIMEYKRYIDGTQESHLVPGYKEAMFSIEDQNLYHKIKDMPGIKEDNFMTHMERIMTYPGKQYYPASCGQKLIPLRVKDVEESENIKHTPWREMYISSLVGDLVINGISPSFPIFVDWFFISTNSPSIWDNKVSHQKLDHSMVATDIVHKLEEARKSTYEFGENGEEYYVTYQMEGMSEAIEVPIEYAEKELILAPVTLCSLVEHVGRTFADTFFLLKIPAYYKELGPIFDDVQVFGKYLFEYIYGIYAMNKYFHLIHTDLHLNNITFYTVRRFYNSIHDSKDVNPLVSNAHILYDLSDKNTDDTSTDKNIFIFPHYGRYGMIIDFSRGIIGREQLMKDFPEHTTDQIISNQRKRLFRTIRREMPDFVKDHSSELEAFLLQNFDLAFKLYTALDTYKLSRGMLNILKLHMNKLDISPQVIKFVQNVHDKALHILTIDVQKAFRHEIKEYDLPNLRILQECFSEFTVDKFDQKNARRNDPDKPVSIIDIFQIRNGLTYDIRKYDKFPPTVKFDYIVDNNIPIDRSGLKNFEKHLKYLKTNPIEKVYELAEELKAERPIRRGTPESPKQSKSSKSSKEPKSAKTPKEPKKEVHLEEGDKVSDLLSSSSM
jgi:hypothetical protein